MAQKKSHYATGAVEADQQNSGLRHTDIRIKQLWRIVKRSLRKGPPAQLDAQGLEQVQFSLQRLWPLIRCLDQSFEDALQAPNLGDGRVMQAIQAKVIVQQNARDWHGTPKDYYSVGRKDLEKLEATVAEYYAALNFSRGEQAQYHKLMEAQHVYDVQISEGKTPVEQAQVLNFHRTQLEQIRARRIAMKRKEKKEAEAAALHVALLPQGSENLVDESSGEASKQEKRRANSPQKPYRSALDSETFLRVRNNLILDLRDNLPPRPQGWQETVDCLTRADYVMAFFSTLYWHHGDAKKCFTIARDVEHRINHQSSSRKAYLAKMEVEVLEVNCVWKEHMNTSWEAAGRDSSSPFPSNP